MRSFPFLLFQTSNNLQANECMPDRNDGHRLTYDGEAYDNGKRPFEMSVAWIPNGLVVRRLFVHPSRQGSGIGCDIVNALKRTCIEDGYERIVLDDVLTGAVSFWQKRGFFIHEKSVVWRTQK